MTATKTLVIPAAGSGRRMQKETPKPYLKLKGRLILEHTLNAFLSLDGLQQVLVATSDPFLDQTQQILDAFLPANIIGQVVPGGEERQHSIRNALRSVADVDLILVHDAVRPFVKKQQIEACCKAALEIGAAIVGVPAKDTIKRIDDQHIIRETPDRSSMWQAQTPQVFRKLLLIEAYEYAAENQIAGTDDASLVEALGQPVKIVKGDRMNIKLTYPMDLELAKLLMNQKLN